MLKSHSTQLTLDPVRLWSCPVQAYSFIAREYFKDFPGVNEDCYVDLEGGDIDPERIRRLQGHASFCAHCAVSEENIPWCKSRKERGEW